MAKKKSKRFIIPAAFFINTIIEEKLDTPIKNTETFKQPVVSLINEPKTDYASDKKNITFRFIYSDTTKTISNENVDKEHIKITKEIIKQLEKY